MSDLQKAPQVAAPHTDDRLDFGLLTDRYRRELLVHCYRILGSLEDAEDALQEALFNAWRQFDSLRSLAALRAWLYKIATNVSLNMLARRRVRSLPPAAGEPANPRDALQAPIMDAVWLDPLPDEYIAGDIASPEACYETKESVTLAFLAALQILPGRQRAILIMRDVLGWNTAEIGDLLDQSIPAVNSALQRARATIRKNYTKPDHRLGTDDERIANLLARFAQAWETGDSASLVALLREDAILSMPPLPGWYRGRDAIREFLDRHLFAASHTDTRTRFRVTATRANGCPALASYQLDEAGMYRPGAILILTLEGDQIVQLDDFLALDDRLFLRFNLPLCL
jgi:RNA polymerase sigma-70 factor, ECF subfamily